MRVEDLCGLAQPDQRTCGPSALVAARMLVDPTYRPAAFGAEVLALHAQVTAASAFGRAQLPWPRRLGTPMWAAARAMTIWTGVRYRTRTVRVGRRSDDVDAVRAALGAGLPCPVYVGSDRLPRHVVLAVATTAAGVLVYNPARGTLVDMSGASFESGALDVFGRWVRPWFVVAPTDRDL